jgi:hypothetical protein
MPQLPAYASSRFKSLRSTKKEFWRQLTFVKFALAPPGFGIDTHRFWEILHMGAVPIVLSSPLDRLYSQFPVVIVKDWREVFEENALERFEEAIVRKYGVSRTESLFSAEVRWKLREAYWIGLIKNDSANLKII